MVKAIFNSKTRYNDVFDNSKISALNSYVLYITDRLYIILKK